MIVQLFINNDGYLGGWGNPSSIQKFPEKELLISKEDIAEAKKNSSYLLIEIPLQDMPIFNGAIVGRDFIEILPSNVNKCDIKIGKLKLKFNENQDSKMLKSALEGHKKTYEEDTHNLNDDEKMIKELYKI